MFLGALRSVADVCDRELTEETRCSLDLALRYFREAAPKHTADEEESLFPRVRKISDPELQACLARLDSLEADHRWAEPLHQRVEELGSGYLQKAVSRPPSRRAFESRFISFRRWTDTTLKSRTTRCFPLLIAFWRLR